MLLVVSTNPAIDRTLHVPVLEVGHVHRTSRVSLGAGGKGLNVARAARTLGLPARVTGCLAGHTGDLVADLAREEGLEAVWHWLPRGETRNCLLLNHAQGDATVINEPGPVLSPEDWSAFAGLVESLSRGSEAVVLAGSVPPSVSPEAYAELCRWLVRRGVRVYVDTPGTHLAALIHNPKGLALKVNRAELSAALGRSLDAEEDLLKAMRGLIETGALLVAVTMGAAGALAATAEGTWRVEAPPADLVSSVGSGDSFLAGLAAGEFQDLPLPEALRLAAACGAANAATPLPARFDAERVEELRRSCLVETVSKPVPAAPEGSSDAPSAGGTAPELMEQALEFLTQELKAERALVLYEGLGAARGIDPETIWTFGEVSQELLRSVLQDGEPIVLIDAMSDAKYGSRNSVILSNLRSILCVPLRSPGSNHVNGLLYADNRLRSGAFHKDHLAQVRLYGGELQIRLAGAGDTPTATPDLDIQRLLEIEWL